MRATSTCLLVSGRSDLIPPIRTNLSMISQFGKGDKHVQNEAHRSRDHRRAEAGGGGAEGGGRGAGSGSIEAHDIYAWKAKYGGMDVNEAQEVKQLREENGRLKKLVADLSLDKDALQSVIRKNGWSSQS